MSLIRFFRDRERLYRRCQFSVRVLHCDVDIDRIVEKAIAEGGEMMYSSPNGKPDRIKGHRKGVSNGPN